MDSALLLTLCSILLRAARDTSGDEVLVAGPRARPDQDNDSVLGVPGWILAVAVCVLCSTMTVGGLALQKRAVQAPRSWYPKVGSIVLSPCWIFGLLFGMVAPVPMQVWAYSLAPMSLTTPLGGVTVALNMVAAPILLGERLQLWPDLPATAVILAGTALTTVAGTHHEVDYTFEEMLTLWGQAAFLLAMLLLVGAVACAIGFMMKRRAAIEASALLRPANPDLRHVLLPALVAAGCGCFANLLLKGFGELVKGKAAALQCFLCLVAAAIPAAAQLNYVNRGLRLYQQTVFVPIYSSLLVLTNTCYGLICYKEYSKLFQSVEKCLLFSLGVTLVTMGVVLFTRRRSSATDAKHMLGGDLCEEVQDGESTATSSVATLA